MDKQLIFPIIIILVLGAVIAAVALLLSGEAGPEGCPKDARVCPDGSTVGRAPPDCEFEACPDVPCAKDAKICPGGSSVFRVPPDCEFEECPSFDARACRSDFDCMLKYNIRYGGDCVAGCFHRDVEMDPSCDMTWEPMQGSCACVGGKCEFGDSLCGDHYCSPDEDCTCLDCGCPAGTFCNPGDLTSSITSGCSTRDPAVCDFDQACDANENCSTCPFDCGTCPQGPPEEDPCDQWVSKEKKAECYTLNAEESGDMGLCGKIELADLRANCYKLYAMTWKDPTACLNAGPDYEEACFKSANNWVEDYKKCLEIPRDTDVRREARDRCLDNVGRKTLDDDPCREINHVGEKFDCVEYVAFALNTLEGCLMLLEEDQPGPTIGSGMAVDCFRELIDESGDVSLCNNLGGTFRWDCIFYGVMDNRLSSLRCTGLELEDEYLCRAVADNDRTLCYEIDDDAESDWCDRLWTGGELEEEVHQVCEDSDGGVDYFEKGTLEVESTIGGSTSTLKHYESCADADTLREVYCIDDELDDYGNLVGEIMYTCPGGCADGACIS